MNEQVIKDFGLKHGAAHTEFIKSDEDGEIYFLASSRVGGAHLAMVAAASDINLWKEWAIEDALVKEKKIYVTKSKKKDMLELY
jgi:biotin carboxylase